MEKPRLERNAREHVVFDRKFFATKEDKDAVYEIAEAFVETVRQREIKNIILPDSSARPLWIGFSELWHLKYPEERMPGIFFINPDGFHEGLDSDFLRDLSVLFGDSVGASDVLEEIGQLTISPRKIERFRNLFSGLMKDKDENLMILDTCIHTGTTMKTMLDVLKKAGFTKVKSAAVSKDKDYNDFNADFYLLDHETSLLCYPAAHEGLVEKSEDIISERSNNKLLKEYSRRTREEIKDIIAEHKPKN